MNQFIRFLKNITCTNLDETIEKYTKQLGYRLEMIFPADSPREALMSKNGETFRLKAEPTASAVGDNVDSSTAYMPPAHAEGSAWVVGRAGMQYRDLIPDRMDGKVIASHIRIPNGGEVADYVHYHKVGFQMIYCVAGTIRVVYEDQGEPFWLKQGDCVLPPPEIRHRVLEAEANSEVVEISSPAVHETWADHDLTLPNAELKTGRNFSGQQFVRHIEPDVEWEEAEIKGFESRDTGIADATNGLAEVRVLRTIGSTETVFTNTGEFMFYFVLNGKCKIRSADTGDRTMKKSDSFVLPPGLEYTLITQNKVGLLEVCLRK